MKSRRTPPSGGKSNVHQNANADESMLREKLRIAGRRRATDTGRGSSPNSEAKDLPSGTIKTFSTNDSKKALPLNRETPPTASAQSQPGEATASGATMASEKVAEKTRFAGRRSNMAKEKPDRPGTANITLAPPDCLPARGNIDTTQRTPEVVDGLAKKKKGLTDSILDEKLRLAGRRHPAKPGYDGSNKAPASGAAGTNGGSAVPVSNTLGAELKSSTDGTRGSSYALVNSSDNQQQQTNETIAIAGRSYRSTGTTSLFSSGSSIHESPGGKDSKDKEALALAASVSRLFPLNRAVNNENEDEMTRVKAEPARTGHLALTLAGGGREPEAPESNNQDEVAPGAFRVHGFDAPQVESEDSIRIGYTGESVRDLPKTNEGGEQPALQEDALLVQAHVVVEGHDQEPKDRGLIVEAEPTMPESWWKRHQAWLVGFAVLVVVAIIVAIVVTTVDFSKDDNDTPAPTVSPTTFTEGVENGILDLVTRAYLPSDLQQPGTPQALQWVTNQTLQMGAQVYTDTRVLQQYSLATLFFSTNATKSPWSNSSGWLNDPNECEWEGVRCDDDMLVTALVLPRNGLSSTLPAELVLLSDSLTKLDLSGNDLFGSLAPEIGQLALLTDLLLGSNRFSQGIPATFGRLANLVNLDLSDNALKSEIPSEVGLLANARSINFGSNKLIGEIPSDIGALTRLESLRLGRNRLSSSLPAVLGNMTSLEVLHLQGNPLNGPIPTQFGLLRRLKSLDVSACFLVSTIPSQIGLLQNLNELALADSFITGIIPLDIGGLTQLSSLNLRRNSLQGLLPTFRPMRRTLLDLDLSQNDFIGSLPDDFWSLTSLTNLNISWNFVSGTISSHERIGRLANLTSLSLSFNLLSGNIPSGIGVLRALKLLELSNNNFYSSLPTEIGSMINLATLDLWSNRIEGTIPSELSLLSSLSYMDLSRNAFSGTIPPFGKAALEFLELGYNMLSGPLPKDIRHFSRLEYFSVPENQLTGTVSGNLPPILRYMDISGNNVTGSLPSELGLLTKLTLLNLFSNDLSSTLPTDLGLLASLRYMDANDTGIQGKLPVEMTRLPELRILSLGYNSLTGTIPTGFETSISLEELLLTANSLNGTLPPDIFLATNLRLLDMEGNQITGKIPDAIGRLTSLELFVLSGNLLSGRLPSEIGLLAANLKYLRLANNALTGRLPTTIGSFTDLQLLDLSGNSLSQNLPGELGNLTSMFYLNLADNSLTGSIPSSFGSMLELFELRLNGNPLTGSIPSELRMMLSFLTVFSIEETSITGSIEQVCDLYYLNGNTGFPDFRVECNYVDCTCCNSCFTTAPTATPTFSPYPTSTPNPTGGMMCAPFSSIAGVGSELSISFVDDFRETVILPFEFPWPGEGSYSEVVVSTNGQVFPGTGSEDSLGTISDFVELGGAFGSSRIAVAATDLNPGSAGSIYTAAADDSFLISWEGVAHYVVGPNSIFDFQLALFPDGRVELRWGEGRLPENQSVAAGIEDDQVNLAVPAMGVPFDEMGVATAWPINQCRGYQPVEGGFEQSDDQS